MSNVRREASTNALKSMKSCVRKDEQREDDETEPEMRRPRRAATTKANEAMKSCLELEDQKSIAESDILTADTGSEPDDEKTQADEIDNKSGDEHSQSDSDNLATASPAKKSKFESDIDTPVAPVDNTPEVAPVENTPDLAPVKPIDDQETVDV